jgi:hypothetical protein
MLSSLLAISWQPELHGIVIVVIAVGTLCGSVYLLLGTNLGARLGLLIALAGLFGWMSTMGFVWWAYGIGLRGKDPSWKPSDAIVANADLSRLGIGPSTGLSNDPVTRAAQNVADLKAAGWKQLASDNPARALAVTGSDAILQQESGLFKAGDYVALNVFSKGGQRYPLLFNSTKLDFLAFWHKPRFAIVEVAVVKPVYTEPGRAPRTPTPDPTIQHVYVKMVRDLGNRRKNSALIGIGSSIIFGMLCWLLHKRDRLVERNRTEAA